VSREENSPTLLYYSMINNSVANQIVPKDYHTALGFSSQKYCPKTSLKIALLYVLLINIKMPSVKLQTLPTNF